MSIGLLLIFVSVFGVKAPEIGLPCTEALAQLYKAGLGPQSVVQTDGTVTHTLVGLGRGERDERDEKDRRSRYNRYEKVAVVVCGGGAVIEK